MFLRLLAFDLEDVSSSGNLEEHFIDSNGLVHWNFFNETSDYEFVDWNFSGDTSVEFGAAAFNITRNG